MSAAQSGGTEYALWVNDERTVLVRLWSSGIVEVCTREPGLIWGPPIVCDPEGEHWIPPLPSFRQLPESS